MAEFTLPTLKQTAPERVSVVNTLLIATGSSLALTHSDGSSSFSIASAICVVASSWYPFHPAPQQSPR